MFLEINPAYLIAFTFLLTSGCYSYISIVTLVNNTKSKTRGDYLSAGLCLVVFSLSYCLMTISVDESLRWFFWAAGFISGCLFFSRWLLFSTNMVKVNRTKIRRVVNAASVATLVISVVCVLSNDAVLSMTKYGVQFSYQNSLLFK
ncbi:MAG: hypothetical protein FWE55_05260, partial [Synergistaceae bacterium]|nr:hypothetical protein [Synergistaceae bacterium]